MAVAVDPLSPVLGQAGYVVVTGGDYELLELVPCRRVVEAGDASCAFLAATVIGQDPNEISE
jgi:hypothetical protein